MSVPGKMHSFFVPGISLIGVGACHGIPHYVHTYHITKPLIVKKRCEKEASTGCSHGRRRFRSHRRDTAPSRNFECLTKHDSHYLKCPRLATPKMHIFSRKAEPSQQIGIAREKSAEPSFGKARSRMKALFPVTIAQSEA